MLGRCCLRQKILAWRPAHSIPFHSDWGGRSTPPKGLDRRPQHGSISHPQKIPSKYWVLKVRGRNSKKHNYPRTRMLVADQIMSLRSSDYSTRQPLKRRGTARFNIRSMGSTDPTGNCPIRAVHLSQPAGHAVTSSTRQGGTCPQIHLLPPDSKAS